MQNIEITINEDDILTIRVNLRDTVGFTTSGKNALVASTGGNVLVWTPEGPHTTGARVNCSVFRPLRADEKEGVEKALNSRPNL